ncbi:PREDICTED: glutamate receptor ionotropic, NMDA 2A-like [Priapulus caudatus]|uniref:Glutamate receptor ionotropic, NMDA 2A-like n=1 Tax=Priapulus caudatus TaxID=37621 RepID=A0ABM1ETU9_PRICU|nr:PREDICTED: glutamate receptor ionotropic, NMDA 2A-like [Priapulus caudatus]
MIADDEYSSTSRAQRINRLINPTHYDPAFKFGTIPFGSTEENIKANQPYMYRYMQQYNTDTLAAGVKQVKEGKLHAFVYDAMALQYLVGQDNDCRLLQVGSWFAMTGYGIAFPKNSKFIKKINRQVLAYRESGMLERLQRFWFMGDCKRQDQEKEVSTENFH